MAELKTKMNDQSVQAFLDRVQDEKRRRECYTILELIQSITHAEPKMWGDSIVGFGNHHYVYASGREGDWPLIGFSPRKQNLTLYFMSGFASFGSLLSKLGKHTLGKGCLYIKHLEDVDLPILEEFVRQSVESITGKKE